MSMTRRSFLELMAMFSAGRAFAAPAGVFSGGTPKLAFAAISDVHIVHPKGNRSAGTQVFEHALDWYRRQGVDAVMIAGDLADSGIVDELEMLGAAWRKMLPGNKAPDGRPVEKIFVTGNHDFEAWKYGAGTARKLYPTEAELAKHRLADHYPEAWEAAFDEKYEPIYMKTVRGYRFIGSHWTVGRGRQWGERLEKLIGEHAGELKGPKPFFYVQHPHPLGTVFNVRTGVCDDGRVTEALRGFPNAVAFSGHSHWAITDERSIWQGGFTSVNLGCLRRTGFCRTANAPNGYENWRTPGARRKTDAGLAANRAKAMPQYGAANRCHHGMLVKVYEDRIVLERREFTGGAPVAPDWVMPLPYASDGPYEYKSRSERSIAPQFADGAKLTVEQTTARNRGGELVPAVRLTFPAANAERGARPFDYRVEIVDGDGKSSFRAVLAQGAELGVDSEPARGVSSCVLARASLPPGPLTFKVQPGECFGKLGRPISAKFGG